MPLLLIFIVMPVIEMWLLITVGQHIGAMPTIGLVLLTAAVGYALLKQQGFATLFRARQKLESGELPAEEMAEALVLAVSGALLLTPGFFTDTIGFLGLIPMTRRYLIRNAISKMNVSGYQTYSTEYEVHRKTRPDSSPQRGQRTLDGEFWEDDENKK